MSRAIVGGSKSDYLKAHTRLYTNPDYFRNGWDQLVEIVLRDTEYSFF